MCKRVVGLALFITLILATAACDAEATPFPVDLPPTPTATPDAAALLPLRYALLSNTAGAVPDLTLIQGSGADVTQLTDPAADLTAYDIVVTYGDQSGWTRSELTPHIALMLNPEVTPLNQPEILSIVRRSLNPSNIVTALNIPGAAAETLESSPPASLRTELANLGLPDGIALTLAVTYIPGAASVITQMHTANIETQPVLMTVNEARTAFEDRKIQAALVIWAVDVERNQWVQRFGAENVIDLYTVPISYQVKPGLTLSFTPAGFPLITR